MFHFQKQYRKPEIEHETGIYGLSDSFRLHWDIITICDLNCPYCYARKQLEWNKISSKKHIDKVISQLKEIKQPLEVILLGGEPSMSPHYFYILDQLDDISLSTACLSNGMGRVNKEWIDKHSGYSNFYFNFTYHPSETDVSEFKKNIKTAAKYKLLVHVMLLGPKWNDKIVDILDYCKELDVEVKANIPFEPTGLESYMLKNDRYREWILKLKPYFKDYLYFEGETTRVLHDIDVYLEGLNKFKGWKCLNNNYTVEGSGSSRISRMCDRSQPDGKYMICTLDECLCQGLLSNEKIY